MNRESSIAKLTAKSVAALLVLAASSSMPNDGWAQQYPSKPIRAFLTVSGGGETNARLLWEKVGESLGVPVVAESQSAAGGAVAATTVARAAPDGYTVLYATPSSMILRKYMVTNVPYDTARDFVAVARVGDATWGLVAHPSFPANSLAELIDYARRNPAKVSYGTPGMGTMNHLSGVLIEQLTGIRMVHVPYKTAPQSVTDLVGGRIQVLFGVMSNLMPMVKAGKMKVVAINMDHRYRSLPEVATIAETLPSYRRPPSWIGIFVPAGTPQSIVRRLSDEVLKAAHDPHVKAKIEASGTMLDPLPAEQFALVVGQDIELAARLMPALGIKPE